MGNPLKVDLADTGYDFVSMLQDLSNFPIYIVICFLSSSRCRRLSPAGTRCGQATVPDYLYLSYLSFCILQQERIIGM